MQCIFYLMDFGGIQVVRTDALWHEFFRVENMGKINQDNGLGKIFLDAASVWNLLTGFMLHMSLRLNDGMGGDLYGSVGKRVPEAW